MGVLFVFSITIHLKVENPELYLTSLFRVYFHNLHDESDT
jgi:hypothetical protein